MADIMVCTPLLSWYAFCVILQFFCYMMARRQWLRDLRVKDSAISVQSKLLGNQQRIIEELRAERDAKCQN